MNKENLIELQELISEINFFDFMTEIDEDDFFNLRDSEDFENEWLAVSDNLETINFDDDLTKIINQIREISFKKVFSYTKNSEISAYISDDFELIAKSLLLNQNNWVLTHLWQAYQNKKIYIE